MPTTARRACPRCSAFAAGLLGHLGCDLHALHLARECGDWLGWARRAA